MAFCCSIHTIRGVDISMSDKRVEAVREVLEFLGEDTLYHIDTMYPKVFRICPKSARISIRNFINNRVKLALCKLKEISS